MEHRTLMALIAAPLLLVAGVAAAQTNATASTEARPTWALRIEPAEASVAPGATVSFAIILETRADTELKLDVIKATAGAAATVSADALVLASGNATKARLVVQAPANATAGPIVVVVQGTSASGEVHAARALVHVRAPHEPTPRPEPRPMQPERPYERPNERPYERPHERPAPDREYPDRPYRDIDYDARIADIEARLLTMRGQIDEYLRLLREMRELVREREQQHPAIRIELANAVTYVGPEGARIAVLIHNDGPARGLHLKLRADETAGWRAAIAEDELRLPHGRSWTFLKVQPTANATDVFAFGLVAGDRTVAEGKAILVGGGSSRMT